MKVIAEVLRVLKREKISLAVLLSGGDVLQVLYGSELNQKFEKAEGKWVVVDLRVRCGKGLFLWARDIEEWRG